MRVLLVFLIALVLRGTNLAERMGLALNKICLYACVCFEACYFLSPTGAAQSTCTDLQRLASRASSGISCNRNSQCSQLQCDVTQAIIRTYISRATLTLLPCNQPPAVRLVLYNPSNAVIVNRTFDSTTTLTLANGVLSVTVTVQHPTSSSLRLGVNMYYTVLVVIVH